MRTADPPVALPPGVHRGQRPKGLGVEDERRPFLTAGVDQLADELGGGEAGPESRSDHQRVVLVVEDARECRLRVELLDIVLRQRHRRGLDDLRREKRLERLGHGQGDEPDSRPTGGATDQQGGAGVVERPGDDQ